MNPHLPAVRRRLFAFNEPERQRRDGVVSDASRRTRLDRGSRTSPATARTAAL